MGKKPKFWFGFGSVLADFLLSGSVLGKTWVLVPFVLAGFSFFPMALHRRSQAHRVDVRVEADEMTGYSRVCVTMMPEL